MQEMMALSKPPPVVSRVLEIALIFYYKGGKPYRPGWDEVKRVIIGRSNEYQNAIIAHYKYLIDYKHSYDQLEDITYEEISEDFPKPIQYDLVKRIAEVISPSYEEIRKN